MASDSWNEVKSKVEGLGLKLKLHLEQEEDPAVDTATPGDTRAAYEEFGEKLQEAFTGFGNAAKDPAVRTDVKEIGLLIKDALQETLTNVGAEMGDTFKKTKGEAAAEKTAEAVDTPEPPTDTPEA